MRLRNLTIGAAALSIVGQVVTGASAFPRPASDSFRGLPDPAARPNVQRATEEADALRGALSDHSFSGKVTGLLEAANTRLPAATRLPGPDDAPGPLPAGVAGPLTELSAAVTHAADLLGTFSPDDVAAAVRAMRAPGASWREVRGGAIDDRSPGFAVPDPGERELLPTRMRRAADALPAAAMLVAAALDRAIPALEAAPDTGRRGTADACDLLDQAPVLCVGSEAHNVHTKDAALLVDLGGDDEYQTSAGGAPFLPPGAPAYLPVSITVDLEGADTYAAPRLPGWASWDTTVAQAAAAPGALGILVDRQGHDRYTVDVPEPEPGKPGVVVAQGGSFGGFAALFDGAGDDEYRITAPDGEAAISVFAQGTGWRCSSGQAAQTSPAYAGASCAVGALVDEGEGIDDYLVDGGRALASEVRGARVVYAQSAAQFGTGVLSDGGGRDVLRIAASAHRTDLLSYPTSAETPTISLNGQSSVIGGNAFLLTGNGDTTYELRGEVEGMATGWLSGQSFGAGGWLAGMNHGEALAILDDLGGDDTYATRMDTHFEPEIVIQDPCETLAGDPCTRAEVLVDAYHTPGSTSVHAQAAGGFDSRPVLRDRGGDDTYEAIHDVVLDVTVRDELAQPEGPPFVDVKTYKDTWLYAQGWGICGARSLLADEDGADSYLLRASTHVEARATSAAAQAEPEVHALSGTRLAFGQGSGLSGWICSSNPKTPTLADLGGAGDRFEATATSTAVTHPNPDGALQDACCWGAFQGGVGGRLIAEGADVEVSSAPNQGVCEHSTNPRGFGEWMNCWQQGASPEHQTFDNVWVYPASGRVLSSAGSPTSLALVSDIPEPTVAEGRLELVARLTEPGGQPIEGAPVVFGLQRHVEASFFVPLGPFWSNLWEVTGVTDEDGVARASLPMTLERWNHINKNPVYLDPDSSPFQVMASYHGAPGLHPAKATAPITLTSPED